VLVMGRLGGWGGVTTWEMERINRRQERIGEKVERLENDTNKGGKSREGPRERERERWFFYLTLLVILSYLGTHFPYWRICIVLFGMAMTKDRRKMVTGGC